MTGQAVGRLIAVVGPSGVGKDSVMNGLVQGADVHLVRRVITRQVTCKNEGYEATDEAGFLADLAAGRFCLNWQAHGLHYGVPCDELTCLGEGRDALVNLSRGALLQAQALFPSFRVLYLSAPEAVLQKRLAARGRECAAGITQRLQRRVPLPEGVEMIHLQNDGPLDETIARATWALGLRPKQASETIRGPAARPAAPARSSLAS